MELWFNHIMLSRLLYKLFLDLLFSGQPVMARILTVAFETAKRNDERKLFAFLWTVFKFCDMRKN